jgi:hypothetical protein
MNLYQINYIIYQKEKEVTNQKEKEVNFSEKDGSNIKTIFF